MLVHKMLGSCAEKPQVDMGEESQILRLTAVLIAAKFVENSDEQQNLLLRMVAFTVGSCIKQDFVDMELRILAALDFRIGSRPLKRWRRRLNTGRIDSIDLE